MAETKDDNPVSEQEGLLRHPSEITGEEELDDHFDDLSRLYRQICLEMGLAWPPLPTPGETR